MVEKKQELEKRLQDVTVQLGASKKATKKGKLKITLYGELTDLIYSLSLSLFVFVDETTSSKVEAVQPTNPMSSSSSSSDSSSSSSSDSSSSDSSDSEAG